MKKLRYSNGKKERYNVNLDTGIVKKSKELLEKGYPESFSGLIDARLDQWCQDEEALNIMDDAMKDMKKKGSVISEEKMNKLLYTPKSEKILQELKKEGGKIKKK